jgi:nitrite reductase/ring-hydroxylating ferredoxin subunit
MCSSHGALFRTHDGLCVSGPCKGSHLRPLPVEVRGDAVLLDTSKLGAFFNV